MDSRIYDKEYKEALDWLFSQLPMFSRVGAPAYKPGLQTIEALDRIFLYPHKKFKSIHVAGTNGKGSTSHMLAAVLQRQGYKTGLYTSPHLTDFRERMRINGKMIPKEEVVRFVKDWKDFTKGNNSSTEIPKPSFFELTMMMALQWFAKEKVDYAVVETGMGGRLDSTNVITPILSIITNISFDHTQFLGDTLEAIAGEKAGIIKTGIPVVVGEAEGKVKDVFIRKAAEVKAPVIFAEESPVSPFENVDLPLKGSYQKKNLHTVLTALEQLRKEGVEISDENIVKGLEGVVELTGLRGRWQIVSEKPVIICDTGHNVAGITETMQTLKDRYAGRKIRFVIGFVSDKDVSNIVGLFPENGEYYFTRASIPRAMETEKVSEYFAARGIRGKEFATVGEAFNDALKDSSEEDVIYIGGSTFIVADFLATHDKQL